MQTDLEANLAVNQTQFKVWLIFGRWYFNAGWHFLRSCSFTPPTRQQQTDFSCRLYRKQELCNLTHFHTNYDVSPTLKSGETCDAARIRSADWRDSNALLLLVSHKTGSVTQC